MARQIIVEIVGDSKKYSKATNDAVKATVTMETTFGKLKSSIAQGLGVGAGLGVFSLATKGIGMVTDALGNAVQAAIDDEKATAQLNQTIKANVKNWDGSNAAVDEAIAKGAQLAFTDDDVRAGLNQLIPRTHDIAQANKLNALAMDLARAKGLSLEEAATLVGKAYNGQASALKRAGINIKNTKDSTAALAELQKMVSGQAEKYAGTTQGAMERMDIATSEAMESIGYAIKPVVAALAGLAADVVTGLAGAFDTSNKSVDKGVQFINDYAASLDHTTPKVIALTAAELALQQAMKPDPLQQYTQAFDDWVSSSADGLQQETLSLQSLRGEAAGTFDIVKWMTDLNRSFAMASKEGAPELGKLAQAVALAGGDFDDFVLKIQEMVAASVDVKGIAESYRREFDPMSRTVAQFVTEWLDGAKKVESGKITWQQWGQLLVQNTDYIKAHWEQIPKWMQDVAVKQKLVLGNSTGVISKYTEEGINALNNFWQQTEIGSREAAKALHAPAWATERTVSHMLRTMAQALDPWKSAWAQMAAWAKHPFSEKNLAAWIKEKADKAAQNAVDAAKNHQQAAARRWRAIANAMKSPVLAAAVEMGASIDDAVAAILRAKQLEKDLGPLAGGLGTAGKTIEDYRPKGGKKGKKGHGVPVLGDGGIVTAPTLAMIGEAGPEAVVPLGRRGGMGATYNIHVQVAPGGDLVEAGRQMVHAIQQYERRSGKAWRRATPA